MADRLKDLGQASSRAARKYAAQQAEAGARYTDVLTKFGSGKTSIGKYSAELAGLAIKETARSAEAYWSAGADWVQDVLKILGDSARDGSSKDEDAARETPAKPAARPAAK